MERSKQGPSAYRAGRTNLVWYWLAEILDHDEAKLRHVLGVFLQSTRHDCDQLDAAHAAGDWRRVRELAHKLRSGCRQLGEEVAATSLEMVERELKDEAELAGKFAIARDELHLVLMRVSTYLDT
jgi:HPt (histidine-containing phosphotransfer) domain-containing protein